MLIFLSDLHLRDSDASDKRYLSELIRHIQKARDAAHAEGVESVDLVLLGDIFEILNSTRWIAANCRPWHGATPQAETLVDEIIQSIISSNAIFFDGVRNLVADTASIPFRVVFLFGNHDYVLDMEIGKAGRARVRSALGLPARKGLFRDTFSDARHRVIARHGHQYDPDNRYKGDFVPFGDILVVEIMAQFRHLIGTELQMSPDAASLAFLRDAARVIPQNDLALATWLERGFASLSTNPNVKRAIKSAAGRIVDQFDLLERQGIKQRLENAGEFKRWRGYLTNIERFGGLALKAVKATSRGGASRFVDWGTRIGRQLQVAHEEVAAAAAIGSTAEKRRIFVFGHTHQPTLGVIDGESSSSGPEAVYVNTGTWGPVFYFAQATLYGGVSSQFEAFIQRDMLSIYNAKEQAQTGHHPIELQMGLCGP
jgi:UDP-2,3-diacylglucosamine pyrophosphatase LpxH